VDNAIQKKNDRLFNQINHFIVRAFSHVPFGVGKEKYISSIGSTSYPVFSFTIPFITIEIVQKITAPLKDYIKLERNY
jgi:hypothetical protein